MLPSFTPVFRTPTTACRETITRQDHKKCETQAMKFVVKKTSNGQFRFNLVASNGQTVATSETYMRKASALETIESGLSS
jgi:uncharacterized protein YegP (UPF0339 family)